MPPEVQIHTVANTYVSAIYHLDYSNLDAPERGELNRWLGVEGLLFRDCISVVSLEGVSRCEISGKLAQCSKVYYVEGKL